MRRRELACEKRQTANWSDMKNYNEKTLKLPCVPFVQCERLFDEESSRHVITVTRTSHRPRRVKEKNTRKPEKKGIPYSYCLIIVRMKAETFSRTQWNDFFPSSLVTSTSAHTHTHTRSCSSFNPFFSFRRTLITSINDEWQIHSSDTNCLNGERVSDVRVSNMERCQPADNCQRVRVPWFVSVHENELKRKIKKVGEERGTGANGCFPCRYSIQWTENLFEFRVNLTRFVQSKRKVTRKIHFKNE